MAVASCAGLDAVIRGDRDTPARAAPQEGAKCLCAGVTETRVTASSAVETWNAPELQNAEGAPIGSRIPVVVESTARPRHSRRQRSILQSFDQ